MLVALLLAFFNSAGEKTDRGDAGGKFASVRMRRKLLNLSW